MHIKMMSEENIQDSDSSKRYTLVPISSEEYVEMQRFENGEPYIIVKRRGMAGGMEFRPKGNTYIIEGNKTISTFSYN